MQRTSTTVVCVVALALLEAVSSAANVRVMVPDPDDAPLDRAVEIASAAVGAHIPYFVHDADPLAVVGETWSRFFDGEAPVGALEVAIADVLSRWRVGSLDLPDYYLVAGAEQLGTTTRHWFGGILHEASPMRVVPVTAHPESIVRALATLRPGRWWPLLDRLLDGLERRVPDQVGLRGG